MKKASPLSRFFSSFIVTALLLLSMLFLTDNSIAIIDNKKHLAYFPTPVNWWMELDALLVAPWSIWLYKTIMKIHIRKPLTKSAIILIIFQITVAIASIIGAVASAHYHIAPTIRYHLQIEVIRQLLFILQFLVALLWFTERNTSPLRVV